MINSKNRPLVINHVGGKENKAATYQELSIFRPPSCRRATNSLVLHIINAIAFIIYMVSQHITAGHTLLRVVTSQACHTLHGLTDKVEVLHFYRTPITQS